MRSRHYTGAYPAILTPPDGPARLVKPGDPLDPQPEPEPEHDTKPDPEPDPEPAEHHHPHDPKPRKGDKS